LHGSMHRPKAVRSTDQSDRQVGGGSSGSGSVETGSGDTLLSPNIGRAISVSNGSRSFGSAASWPEAAICSMLAFPIGHRSAAPVEAKLA
jgi:hypothetical protein